MSLRSSAPGLSWLAILLVALSLSIGWGVRGNWGHEYGAMIPGALAAIAAVVVSGREDCLPTCGRDPYSCCCRTRPSETPE